MYVPSALQEKTEFLQERQKLILRKQQVQTSVNYLCKVLCRPPHR